MENVIKYLLANFINQAETSNLNTRNYIKSYNELKVVVSFGKGKPARIPWIAFLSKAQKITDGIYPLYLLIKKHQLLLLAYGISETHLPVSRWSHPSTIKTLDEYFNENGLTLDRYGNSLLYKVYDINKELNWTIIVEDLHSLIETYKLAVDKK